MVAPLPSLRFVNAAARAAVKRLPPRVVAAVDAAVAAFKAPLPVKRRARSHALRTILQRIRELDGSAWAIEAEEMLEADVRLATADAYARMSIKNARWVWSPGCDSIAAERNADHMNRNFGMGPYRSGRMKRRWRKVIDPITRFIQIGWRLVEPTYTVTWDPGTQRYRYWIADLVDMRPTEHDAWIQGRDGELAGCQYAGSIIRIRDQRTGQPNLVHFVRGDQAGDLEGNRGLLYPARRPYAITKLYDDLIMVGGERWALQAPTVEIDRSIASRHGYTADMVDEMISDAFAAAVDYAAGEGTVLVQNPVARMGTYGIQGNFLPSELVAVRTFYDNLKLHAYFAGVLALGSNETGAKNVGQVLETPFTALVVDASWDISDALSAPDGPAAWVLEASFGPQDQNDLPYLEPDGIDEEPIADLINVIPNWLAVEADTRAPELWQEILRIAHATQGAAPQASYNRRRQPRLRNHDPSAGGVPAAPVAPSPAAAPAEDFQAGNFTGSNRDVADMLGSSTARIASLVRRSVANGIELPSIGSGRDRRWDMTPGAVLAWYKRLAGSDA